MKASSAVPRKGDRPNHPRGKGNPVPGIERESADGGQGRRNRGVKPHLGGHAKGKNYGPAGTKRVKEKGRRKIPVQGGFNNRGEREEVIREVRYRNGKQF